MSKDTERFYRWIECIVIGILSGIMVLIFGQNNLSNVCKPFVLSILLFILAYGFYLKSKKNKYKILFYVFISIFILVALYLFYLGIKC